MWWGEEGMTLREARPVPGPAPTIVARQAAGFGFGAPSRPSKEPVPLSPGLPATSTLWDLPSSRSGLS